MFGKLQDFVQAEKNHPWNRIRSIQKRTIPSTSQNPSSQFFGGRMLLRFTIWNKTLKFINNVTVEVDLWELPLQEEVMFIWVQAAKIIVHPVFAEGIYKILPDFWDNTMCYISFRCREVTMKGCAYDLETFLVYFHLPLSFTYSSLLHSLDTYCQVIFMAATSSERTRRKVTVQGQQWGH